MTAAEAGAPDGAAVTAGAAFSRESRRLREARGWSQTGLARAAGLSQSTIATAEHRGTGCTVTTAHVIASALGTTIDAMIAAGGSGAVASAREGRARFQAGVIQAMSRPELERFLGLVDAEGAAVIDRVIMRLAGGA